MSWIQQQSRRQQGAWVSAMPRRDPMVAGYAKPRGASCPLVGLVGACCSGCAEGKGCGAKEEIEHAHAQQALVGEAAIPWSDVEDTNAKVNHVQEAAAALAGAPAGSPEAQRYMLWYLFYTNWTVWYAAASKANTDWLTFGTKFISGENAEAYKALALAFNEQLKALEALKVQATAQPVDTRSPAAKAFDSTVTGVLSGAGGALGIAGTALTYAAIAGAVVLGLYFAGPPLLSLVMRRGKK